MQPPFPAIADRLAQRERPAGQPIMHQTWDTLLFMHWSIPVEAVRALIPDRLTIDLHEGQAWIGLTPFTVRGARPLFVPRLPWLGDFHEMNVRTYVHLDGQPGVWFFSLDAGSIAAVMGARALYHLPYHYAEISLTTERNTVHYRTIRRGSGPATFSATWTIGAPLPPTQPGSLEFFLIERYCLFSAEHSRLYRCRIHHQPWPLYQASVTTFTSSIIEATGLPAPVGQPFLHAAGPVQVQVWAPEEI